MGDMTVSKDLADLHPDLRPLAQRWLELYTLTGRKAKITQTWRSPEYQAQLHAANPTGAAPSGKSKHECVDSEGKPASKAFDFALYDKHGTYITDGSHEWYRDAGEIAEQLGLKWGGRFNKHPDPDHIELPDNYQPTTV